MKIEKEVSVWELEVSKSGKMKVLMQTHEGGYTMEPTEYEVKAGKIKIQLPKTSATILTAVIEEE